MNKIEKRIKRAEQRALKQSLRDMEKEKRQKLKHDKKWKREVERDINNNYTKAKYYLSHIIPKITAYPITIDHDSLFYPGIKPMDRINKWLYKKGLTLSEKSISKNFSGYTLDLIDIDKIGKLSIDNESGKLSRSNK